MGSCSTGSCWAVLARAGSSSPHAQMSTSCSPTAAPVRCPVMSAPCCLASLRPPLHRVRRLWSFLPKWPWRYIDTTRVASRVRRRPRQFRDELGQTRLLHKTLLTRTTSFPTATTAVALLRLSERWGKLVLQFHYYALKNCQRLYHIRKCDFKAQKSRRRLRLGRLSGHAGPKARKSRRRMRILMRATQLLRFHNISLDSATIASIAAFGCRNGLNRDYRARPDENLCCCRCRRRRRLR
jgi:hypothetical protein